MTAGLTSYEQGKLRGDSGGPLWPAPEPSLTPVLCYPATQITSRGFWLGDSPNTYYALPLLLFQSASMVIVSRLLHLLFKPLHLPSVFSDILAGEILGPLVVGQFPSIYRALFPYYSLFLQRLLIENNVVVGSDLLPIPDWGEDGCIDDYEEREGGRTSTVGHPPGDWRGALVILPLKS